MAQQNIEVVGRFNELLWGHRDIDAALRLVDGDAEFDWSNSRAPYSGLYRGHAAVREAWETATDAWDEFHLDFKEAIEVDRETIVVVTSVRARGKGSGVPVRAEGASVWKVREGKIIRGKLFQSKAEALAAVGLDT